MADTYALSPAGIEAFSAWRYEAAYTVARLLEAEFGAEYERLGEQGWQTCREDIEFHLDFLRPVLETGLLAPYSDYLRWFHEVLAARDVPALDIGKTLNFMGDFYEKKMGDEGKVVASALKDAFAESHRAVAAAALISYPEPLPQWQEFEEALLRGDRRCASAIVDALQRQGYSLAEIDVRLIEASLRNIGLRWQCNTVSVAQEHLATATAGTVMADVFSRSALPPLSGKKVILACVEGNQHAVGLRMVSDALEMDGWDVQFLGANTPARSLVKQAQDWQPDLIGLSIAFAHQFGKAHEAINAIRAACSSRPPHIWVGGSAVNIYPGAIKFLGADGHAPDALAALARSKEYAHVYRS